MEMNLRQQLAKLIDQATPHDGVHETKIPGLRCIKVSQATPCVENDWWCSFAIVAQGEKEVSLAHHSQTTAEAHYIANLVDLAVVSRVTKAPYLALLIDIDPVTLLDVARQMKLETCEKTDLPTHALFTDRADERILECSVRLAKLLTHPEDAPVLAPLAIRELYFLLLKGTHGAAIHQFVSSGSRFHRVAEAIQYWRSDLSLRMDMADLAKKVGMSRTSFFRAFKEVTAMSPIQYQKRLRLIKARQLLAQAEAVAEDVAFKVGYQSAPQFSREYSRFFGRPPMRDALWVRAKSHRPGKASAVGPDGKRHIP